MNQDKIIFGQPWFDGSERALVNDTLDSGWIGQGPLVEQFERELSEYLGGAHVVAVNSCTAALHLALVAADIGPGDEVITTPFTFVATLNAIEHSGATAVLVDIDPVTLNITPDAVAAAITSRTRAIMPVHFAGRPVELGAMYALAEEHDLWIVEDAAHAVGGVRDGRMVGDPPNERGLVCFSFYPNKNLCSAEGGAIATHNDEIRTRLASLRLHGLDGDAWDRYRSDFYQPSLAVEAGFKCNWTDLQAAIGIAQLGKLEGFLAIREYLANYYDEQLRSIEGVDPIPRSAHSISERHALHLYQVAIDGPHPARDAILAELRAMGIGAAVHYIGVNQHPVYADRYAGQQFPVSDWASGALLTLPLHPLMTRDQVDRVVRALETVSMRVLASLSTPRETLVQR